MTTLYTVKHDIPYTDLAVAPNGPAALQAAVEHVDLLVPSVIEGAEYLAPLNATFTTSGTLSTIDIPDPDRPYRVIAYGSINASVAAGAIWDFRYKIDDLSGPYFGRARKLPESDDAVDLLPGLTPQLTGDHSILFVLIKTSGGNATVNLDGSQQQFFVQVIPE